MKKLISLILALCMVLSLSVTASAAGNAGNYGAETDRFGGVESAEIGYETRDIGKKPGPHCESQLLVYCVGGQKDPSDEH